MCILSMSQLHMAPQHMQADLCHLSSTDCSAANICTGWVCIRSLEHVEGTRGSGASVADCMLSVDDQPQGCTDLEMAD